jgi:hypothetical protein
MGLMDLVDGIGERTPTPVLEAMDGPTPFLEVCLVALDHARHLLALARMNQEDHFVMSH